MSTEENALLNVKVGGANGVAMLHEEDLDDESGYSHVYLTAVYHDNIPELKNILKKKFFEVSGRGHLSSKDINNAEDKSFDKEIEELDLQEVQNPDEEDLVEGGVNKDRKDLFYYALSVALLSCLIQLSFIITIIKEYFHEDHIVTSDPELIAIRILAFVTITLKIWIELGNGRKIVLHGIYQGFLYRSTPKRIMSIFMGCVQIFTALSCYFCSSELIVQTETVSDCVKDFSALIILTEIDNWIGEYFLKTSKQMKYYTRDHCTQIYVLKKKEYYQYSFGDLIIDACSIVTFIISIIPIYDSIIFKGTLPETKV